MRAKGIDFASRTQGYSLGYTPRPVRRSTPFGQMVVTALAGLLYGALAVAVWTAARHWLF